MPLWELHEQRIKDSQRVLIRISERLPFLKKKKGGGDFIAFHYDKEGTLIESFV